MSYLQIMHDLRENAQDVSLNDGLGADRILPTPPGQDKSTWLVSFTDVIALMLVFFVMMFSMSHPRQEGWVNIVHGLSQEFQDHSGSVGKDQAGPYGTFDMARVKKKKALSTNYLFAILKHTKEQYPVLENMNVTAYRQKTRITLPYNILFLEAQPTELSPAGLEILTALTSTIGHLNNTMDINLYGPPALLETKMRQASVLARQFKLSGYGGRISLIGHTADTPKMEFISHAAR